MQTGVSAKEFPRLTIKKGARRAEKKSDAKEAEAKAAERKEAEAAAAAEDEAKKLAEAFKLLKAVRARCALSTLC